MNKSVHYLPPDDKLIDEYAKSICQILTEKGVSALDHPDAARGLSQFLRVLYRIAAKERNGYYDRQVDNDSDAC